ncbi:MAG: peptidoglycan DD-metalloendopeptidase family protein [Pseudomonadales bacterium]
MWTKALLLSCGLACLSGCTTESRAVVVERSLVDMRETNYYVVAPGDSLYSIAWRFDTEAELLAEYNGIDPPYLIQPGRRLFLSAKTPRLSEPKKNAEVNKSAHTPIKEGRDTPKTIVHRYTGAWRWPVEAVVTRSFGSGNKGVDYVLVRGQTIHAAASGIVVYTGPGLGSFRNLVIVKHDASYLSAYGMNTDYVVAEGDAVSPDSGIARVLSSANDGGRFHFEVRRAGKPVNPNQLVSAR